MTKGPEASTQIHTQHAALIVPQILGTKKEGRRTEGEKYQGELLFQDKGYKDKTSFERGQSHRARMETVYTL